MEQGPRDPVRPHGFSGSTRRIIIRLRSVPPPELGRDNAGDLLDAATFHGVEGLVREAFGAGDPALDAAVHAAQARHLRACADLALIARALRNEVTFLAVKGPVLVATCYPVAVVRSYVDLDILVAPSDLARAVRVLRAAGLRVLDANWPMLASAGVHEIRLQSPSGGAVDLHWSLKPGPAGPHTATDVERLVERSTWVEIAGERVRTLGPADLLVHVAVHAAASGGHRLVWLTDLRGALEHVRVSGDLARVVRITDEWSARPAVALMLRRLRRTLGTPIPDELAGLVRPGLWGAVVSVCDSLSPPELVRSRGSLSRVVARAASSTTLESVRMVLVKGWMWWRGRGNPALSVEELLDASDPRSALYPVGGDEAAEAFFAQVAGNRS